MAVGANTASTLAPTTGLIHSRGRTKVRELEVEAVNNVVKL